MRLSNRKVAAGVLLLLLALLAWRTTSGFDLGTHMATGRWILAHSQVPEHDPFTYTVSDRDFVAYSWLFQVGLYSLYRQLGVDGITWVRWAILMGTGLLLLDLLRVRRCSALAGSVVALAAILAAEFRFNSRPELVSLFLAAATLCVLERRRQGRRAPLWLLPLIQLLWVNVHVYVLGWLILAPYLLDEVLRRRSLRTPLVAWSCVSFAALFVNPYHYRLVLYPFRLAGMMRGDNVNSQVIDELQSPFMLGAAWAQNPHTQAYALLAVLGVLAVVLHAWKRSWPDVALVATFGVLSIAAVRNLPVFALVAAPSLAVALDVLAAGRARHSGSGRLSRLRARWSGALLVVTLGFAALTAMRVVTGTFYAAHDRPTRLESALCRVCIALDSVEWLADRPISGRGFNNFAIGGTLLWRHPAQKVFIDGRTDVMGVDFLARYVTVVEPASWERASEEFEFEYAILSHSENRLGLAQKLWRDPGWKVVHVDGGAVIFVRADGPNGSLPGVPNPPPVDDKARWRLLDRTRVRGGATARLRRWLWIEAAPLSDSLALGTFLVHMGRLEIAERHLLRAVRESPTSVLGWSNLGALYFRLRLWDEALVAFRNLRALDPEHRNLEFFDEVLEQSRSPAPVSRGERAPARPIHHGFAQRTR